MKPNVFLKRSSLLGLIVCIAAFVQHSQTALAQTNDLLENTVEDVSSVEQNNQQQSNVINNIKSIAEKITVRVDYGSNNGSGVIVARQGNTYYILTAKHVVDTERDYEVVAPDGKSYPLNYSTVKKFEETDLAVFEFESSTSYDVATLANFEQREALHQAKKSNLDVFDPYNPSEAQLSEIRQQAELAQPQIEAMMLAAENTCSKVKPEEFKNCLDRETLSSSQMEDIRQESGDRFREFMLNPGKTATPNTSVDYRILYLFIYGWSRNNGNPQATFSPGRYYKSKLEEQTGQYILNRTSNEFSLRIGNPSAEFTEVGNSSDNFNEFSKDYDVFYTNQSYGGMSGGPVLDYNGNLVAIHTGLEGEAYRKKLKESNYFLGYSNGIFIDKFLNKASQLGISSQLLKIESTSQENLNQNKLQAIDLALANYSDNKELTTDEDWINYGNQMWRLRNYKKASEAFDKAIEINPNLHLAYYGKGKSLAASISDSGNIAQSDVIVDRAYQAYKKATDLKPDFSIAWKEQGDHLLRMTKADVAKINSVPLQEQSQMYEEVMQPKWKLALDAYETAISSDENNAYLYSKKGEILFLQNSCPEALAAYKKAISINPSALHHKHRAIIYMAQGDYERARSDYETYLQGRNPLLPPMGMFNFQPLLQPPSQERDELIEKLVAQHSLDRCSSNQNARF